MEEGRSHQEPFLYTHLKGTRDYKPAIFQSVLSHGLTYIVDLHRCVTRQQHSDFFCVTLKADPRFALFGLVDDPIKFRGNLRERGKPRLLGGASSALRAVSSEDRPGLFVSAN